MSQPETPAGKPRRPPGLTPEVDAYEAAIHVLVPVDLGRIGVTALGIDWRTRAAAHLTTRLDASLRDRPRLNSEEMALGFLKAAAHDLRAAASALQSAAHRLRDDGDAWGANQTYAAARAAATAADHIDPN